MSGEMPHGKCLGGNVREGNVRGEMSGGEMSGGKYPGEMTWEKSPGRGGNSLDP